MKFMLLLVVQIQASSFDVDLECGERRGSLFVLFIMTNSHNIHRISEQPCQANLARSPNGVPPNIQT